LATDEERGGGFGRSAGLGFLPAAVSLSLPLAGKEQAAFVSGLQGL